MIWIKITNKEENIYKNTWNDWYDWLTNSIPEPIKKPWAELKTKFRVFLKSRIIVNKNVSKLHIKVERKNQKKT